MKIKHVDRVALLQQCSTRSQQVYVENFIFNNAATLPKNIAAKIEALNCGQEEIRDTNRSCVKQYILEKFVMKCPYDRQEFYLLINNAIIFKHLQVKDLQQILVQLDSDSNVSCEKILAEHQAISKIIPELSKLRTNRAGTPNNPT